MDVIEPEERTEQQKRISSFITCLSHQSASLYCFIVRNSVATKRHLGFIAWAGNYQMAGQAPLLLRQVAPSSNQTNPYSLTSCSSCWSTRNLLIRSSSCTAFLFPLPEPFSASFLSGTMILHSGRQANCLSFCSSLQRCNNTSAAHSLFLRDSLLIISTRIWTGSPAPIAAFLRVA